MSKVFILQLVLSIIIGGGFVALQTLFAERVSQKIAGVVLSIPSTLAVALFFMGLTISPSAVASVIPVIPVSFGINLLFCTAYVYIANYCSLDRIKLILLSAAGAVFIWLILASPIAYFKITNLIFSLGAYAVFAATSYYFLVIKPSVHTEPIYIRYTRMQILARSIFGGLIIGLVVILAKFLGLFWGAIFSAFPAVYLSTLLIIHWHRGKKFLFHVAKALPVASPIFIIYAFVVEYTYPRLGIEVGTLAAFAVCALYPIALIFALRERKNFLYTQ